MKAIESDTPTAVAGSILNERLRTCSDTPVLLLLSGGSALALLAYIDEAVLGPHVTITTLDERYATDPAVNTFAQIQTTAFFQTAQEHGVQCIDTTISPDETLTTAGERFAVALHEWRAAHPRGTVLATQGSGVDGHTAGIFPGDHGVNFSGNDWVVAYEVPATVNQYTKRITVTYTFLREVIDESILFLQGDEKVGVRRMLEQVPCTTATHPICIVHDMKHVTMVTDIR